MFLVKNVLLDVLTQNQLETANGRLEEWGGGRMEGGNHKFLVSQNHQNHISVLKSMGFDDFFF